MSEEAKAYPQPHEDADNRVMLEAWRAGRLALQACAACRERIFYPRALCPHCWSDRLGWIDAAGRGEIVSFSLIHRPNDPAFFAEAPIVLAEIRLSEGVAMLARVIGADPQALAIGMPVELLPLPEARRYPLPTFRPAAP